MALSLRITSVQAPFLTSLWPGAPSANLVPVSSHSYLVTHEQIQSIRDASSPSLSLVVKLVDDEYAFANLQLSARADCTHMNAGHYVHKQSQLDRHMILQYKH